MSTMMEAIERKLTKEGVPSFANPDGDKFQQNLDKWVEFVSWARWHSDLFLDLITPETGGIRLDLDQRVFIRALVRFVSVYGVFPRGWIPAHHTFTHRWWGYNHMVMLTRNSKW